MIPEILAILFYGIGDTWTTLAGIKLGLIELNPGVKLLLTFGAPGFIIGKIIIIIGFLTIWNNIIWVMAIGGIITTLLNIRTITTEKKYRGINNGTINTTKRI